MQGRPRFPTARKRAQDAIAVGRKSALGVLLHAAPCSIEHRCTAAVADRSTPALTRRGLGGNRLVIEQRCPRAFL